MEEEGRPLGLWVKRMLDEKALYTDVNYLEKPGSQICPTSSSFISSRSFTFTFLFCCLGTVMELKSSCQPRDPGNAIERWFLDLVRSCRDLAAAEAIHSCIALAGHAGVWVSGARSFMAFDPRTATPGRFSSARTRRIGTKEVFDASTIPSECQTLLPDRAGNEFDLLEHAPVCICPVRESFRESLSGALEWAYSTWKILGESRVSLTTRPD
ncbi:uncharacterized protein LOC112346783 isoform X1 [Selaginella moellendorffii]|uniref:uncharacterized protein LOC112346783 isoform X1 n=1 Tax=Selaginella moellendorffii TaxID=88036 RepID=UPI000D1C68F1|nr:uncharacterized protein LOC112346783 isoform X1 [Selaginella moellendorffii]XP_024532186.1 uncharacterized protein LOC112346783 isoform X1 [Selaginella moellendorffii]|eukprot:XP_024532182.1 uncharacterized protein LOC112346783 isoform X1 [Selaginella moellendorffii]